MATTNSRMSRFPTTTRNFSQEGRALTPSRSTPGATSATGLGVAASLGPRVSPSQAPATLSRRPYGATAPNIRSFTGSAGPAPLRNPASRPAMDRFSPTRSLNPTPEQDLRPAGGIEPLSIRDPETGPMLRPTEAQWAGTGARTRAAAQGGTYYDPGSAWQTPLAGAVEARDLSAKQAGRERAADVGVGLFQQSRDREQRAWEQQQEERRRYEEERRAWEAERSRGTPAGRTEYQEGADVGSYTDEFGPVAGDEGYATTDYGLRAAGPAPSGPLTGPFRPTMMPSVQQDFMSAYSAARRRAAAEQAQMRDVESGGFREAGPKQAEAGGEQPPIITAEDLVPPEEYGPQGEAQAQALYEDVGAFEDGGRPTNRRNQFIIQAGGDPRLAALYGSLFDMGVKLDNDGNMSYGDQELGNITDDPATWQGLAGREYGRFLQREQQRENDEFIARERARALPEVQQVDVEPMVAAQQEKRALDQARAMRAMLASGAASGLSPAAMTGTTAQMQQQANIEGQAVDAAMRWQAEVQNNQNAMAAWAAEVNRINALMQTETDMRNRAFLAEESRRAIANQRAHEMELARLQNEITGSDLLGLGLSLLGTVGGAALGGIGGAIGGKIAGSILGDALKNA